MSFETSQNARPPMLRAIVITALVAPGAALLAGAAPKLAPGRARPAAMILAEDAEQPEFITTLTDVGITALRLGTCALMVHHGFDKIQVTLTAASTAPSLLI